MLTLVIPTQVWASSERTLNAEQASQLWSTLESRGYAIHSVSHERDRIEVEAYRDDIEYDVDLDPNTLEIIRERRDD